MRSIVSLDLDHLPPIEMIDLELAYHNIKYFLHSTHKHTAEVPRLRLIVPLPRDVTVVEYEPLARSIAEMLGMKYFDDTTYQPARIMYWPSRASDGESIERIGEGEYIDIDALLDNIDITDPQTWPISFDETP